MIVLRKYGPGTGEMCQHGLGLQEQNPVLHAEEDMLVPGQTWLMEVPARTHLHLSLNPKAAELRSRQNGPLRATGPGSFEWGLKGPATCVKLSLGFLGENSRYHSRVVPEP